MSDDRKQLAKLSLVLFGCFTTGLLLATALHELGHAIAMWVTGGVVDHIELHPFTWSYTYYGSIPRYRVLTSAAGILFSTLCALLLVAIAWKFRHQSWSLLLIATGIGATAKDGMYALSDSLMSSGGDAMDLISLGVPASLIAAAGIMLLTISVLLGILALRRIDFGSSNTLIRRIVVLEAGLLPYLLGIVIYNAIYRPEETALWSSQAAGGAVLVLIIALLSYLVQVRFPARPGEPLNDPSWSYTWFVVILGIAVPALELVWFS